MTRSRVKKGSTGNIKGSLLLKTQGTGSKKAVGPCISHDTGFDAIFLSIRKKRQEQMEY